MKYHPHNGVLAVTLSIEQGLLLLCNPLCEAIIKSCLARANFKYPVKICAFLIEATHVHLLVVVDNPQDVQSFVRHFKTESAHALNRLLGRKKRKIWCDGYDSPIVLTPLRTQLMLSYIYSNPAKDNLEESIEKYPGVSSWQMFVKGEHHKKWKRLRRPMYQKLTPDINNPRGYNKEAARLLSSAKKAHDFHLYPNAWMEAFGITSPEEQEKINRRIVDRVRTIEEREIRKRERSGKKVMGAEKLMAERFDTTHLPNRHGKKMWCLSEDRKLRIRFIQFLKGLFAKGRDVLSKWRVGDFSVRYPMGLYPPSMPKLVEPLSIW